jgi:selenide,water dikinase
MTDVTGFGLLGHLTEMAEGSGLTAVLPDLQEIPFIVNELEFYINQQSVPGGTHRNWDSYGHKIGFGRSLNESKELTKALLADPQTSGGLLIAANKDAAADVESVLTSFELPINRIGYMRADGGLSVIVGD